MGVTQTPVKNDPFEKVSCSSQEEHIFAFCHPEGVDNSSSLAADVSTPSPALSRNCENHTDGNNTSMPSFRSMRTSEPHLPMPTRSPYVVSDCVVSNRSYSRVALLHATSSSPSCDSEQSTTVKRYHSYVSRLLLTFHVNPKDGRDARRKPRRPVNSRAHPLLLPAVP